MSFLKKYWWVIAAVVAYFYWDKIKAMLGKTTVTETPAPLPDVTPESETTIEE